MQFKEETGVGEICYLDLCIKITESRKLEFDIFQKSTYSDAIVSNESLDIKWLL